ncbi:hypothetical protein Poli38472_007054 [Pythium oligandrum]|uniref:WW domain-containing protein n=1 Tax=Pythium oligandrum TaxID=41045 RepID=A0A8K1C9F6_PYTOL|nr:hypothetical protein Poli38472_007054 [Pythium oligandrum]|eukprot:TMW58909.1 hypothetical protein Poli38472_007054 [Pythium oligandrum]
MSSSDSSRPRRSSAKVYVDNSVPVDTVSTSKDQELSGGRRSSQSLAKKRVTLKLSHDISTEQLFSDQLIDGKVADGEDDDDDEEEEETAPPLDRRPSGGSGRPHTGQHRNSQSRKIPKSPKKATQKEEGAMYRIESHSHLSSLDTKKLEKHAESPPKESAASPKPNNRIALAPLQGRVATDTSAETLPPSSTVCTKCMVNKEMPPMHCAAYSGHLNCLALLLDQDDAMPTPSTEESTKLQGIVLDKKKRTPLFYSCAANRLECCVLLLRRRPQWHDLPDKQLDTPVHVCCFFGWDTCLKQLLDAGSNPHGRNAKGFKPSHIAKTKECLELLLSYGDDLLQGDKLGRTPLFVACARDRSLCVEFLCSWNHQTRSWMLEQEDQRGDRPIHAAACNGSNESLEILLKYGADPVIENAKGLTPKALAMANQHPRCVELLTQAEEELESSNAWFAPANAVGKDGVTSQSATAGDSTGGWIECWDNNSGQPFYYNNISGKCQWEVPEGVEPHLLNLIQNQGKQQQQEYEEDDGEYVWVKKKRQTVCVVTGKSSEWTAVQDPVSKAIYYKNTRTGQSQWEEPDAVHQLQSASSAHASQHASKLWDELEMARTALARSLALDKQRQLNAHEAAIEAMKKNIQQRRDDIRKKEEQARLQQLLPRSSFVRRKKQSMMIKMKGSNATASQQQQDEDRMEQICLREPSLDIFLSTYFKLMSVRDLQLTIEKRFFNCLFHYYVALVDPVNLNGMSKSQFRSVLREAGILASAGAFASSNQAQPLLKLHIVDLVFGHACRVEAQEASAALSASASFSGAPHHRQAAASAVNADTRLGVLGFITAMQLVRERMAAISEEQVNDGSSSAREIEDDEEWFLTTYVLPLTVRLGGRLLIQIRQCKEIDLEATASATLQRFLEKNRQPIQLLHRYYTAQEPKLKMLTFRGLSQFAQDFELLEPPQHTLSSLHQLYDAMNWISGNAHTEVISFEKFQQLLVQLAMQKKPLPGDSTGAVSGGLRAIQEDAEPPKAYDRDQMLMEAMNAFFQLLESRPAVHHVRPTDATGNAFFTIEIDNQGE